MLYYCLFLGNLSIISMWSINQHISIFSPFIGNCSINETTWNKNPSLIDREYTTDILFSTDTYKLRCAEKCSVLTTCASWTFTGVRCRGYSKNFNDLSNSVLTIGALYYYDLSRGLYNLYSLCQVNIISFITKFPS